MKSATNLTNLDIVEVEDSNSLFREKHRYKYLVDNKTGKGFFVNRSHYIVEVMGEYKLLGNIGKDKGLSLTD